MKNNSSLSGGLQYWTPPEREENHQAGNLMA
jgi:hypothetical protein